MSSKLWRNVALEGVAAAGAAVWAVAPRTFNDKRRNFVPSIPEVWYAHRGLHDAGSGLVGYTEIADYGGDNPVSAQADTTELSIAENDDFLSLARRMAVTQPMRNISVSQRQMCEIAKAISYNSKVIVLDEPTSSLTVQEVEKLFEMMRMLKEQGIALIYISHKMD